MNRPLLLLLIALFACIAFSSGALADGITPIGSKPSASGGIIEIQRETWLGPDILHRDIVIDTRIVPDPVAAANRLSGTENQASLNCQSTPNQPEAVVAQYCLNAWSWSPSAMPVHVSYNPTDPGGVAVPSAVGPIENAVQQWSSVTPNFQYVYDGSTTLRPTACGSEANADGVNTIAWVDGIDNSPGILAQTCTVRTADGHLLEFDMQINSQIPWSIDDPTPPGMYDLYSNVLHELGHGAGIAHSQYASSDMWSSLASATEKRTLTPDDAAALLANYRAALQVPLASHNAFRVMVPGIMHD